MSVAAIEGFVMERVSLNLKICQEIITEPLSNLYGVVFTILRICTLIKVSYYLALQLF